MRGEKMYKVYLAGFIQGSKLKECIAWRLKIREHFEAKKYPIEWLDPLNGKNLASITADGLKSSTPPHAIVHRDWASVNAADLIVANMDQFGETRPPVGTISECAWAFALRKPLILITDDKNFKYHPFLEYFATAIVPSVDVLLKEKLIQYMYKGVVSAQYTHEAV